MMRLYTAIALVSLLVPALAHADESSNEEEEQIAWGVGVKVRQWKVSKRVQKLFVEDSPGPATDRGAGFDFTRRRGNLEIAFGFGFDRLNLKDGYYVEKGQDPTVPGKVDYTTWYNFRWFTAEASVINHVALHKILELRLGGGIGLGYIRGKIRKTDAICSTNRVPEDCDLDPNATEVNEPADVPPVLPVVNLFVGLELKLVKFLHLHIDAGLHTTPYVGAGATLYLW